MDRPLRPPAGPRRFVFIGGAIALVVAGKLLGWGKTPTAGSSPAGAPSLEGPEEPGPQAYMQPVTVLRRPPSAVAELGVLTDRTEAELTALLDRASIGAALVPGAGGSAGSPGRAGSCGDEPACGAVRMALADEHTTSLQVVASEAWNLEGIDLDASTSSMTAHERASVAKRARVVVVRVAVAPSSRQTAIRTAFAVAGVIAEKTDGLVYDQLLGRIETARGFAAHAITAPLDVSAFRKDRIELLYEPRENGIVRILTAGLSRWGGPDVEAAAVPLAGVDRVADIVLGVAEAIANGASSGPVTLSRDDLSRARGEAYAADPTLPDAAPIAIDLAPVHPEGGDPNDFMARIEPVGGEGPLAYLELSERFFGRTLAASPGEASLRASRDKAQRALPAALARWSAVRADQSLLLRLPFEIPGEAADVAAGGAGDAGSNASGGTESMWIDVTGYDARTVTGKLVDDPLGATQFTRGDSVTRPRSDVEDIAARDGSDHGDR